MPDSDVIIGVFAPAIVLAWMIADMAYDPWERNRLEEDLVSKRKVALDYSRIHCPDIYMDRASCGAPGRTLLNTHVFQVTEFLLIHLYIRGAYALD